MANIAQYPTFNKSDIAPLTKQEMMDLFMHRSNPEARERLINGNVRFVYYIVSKYYKETPNFSAEDLISTGFIGLIKAVDTFDPTSNYQFATYAAVCIRNEIGMALRKVIKRQNEVCFSDVVYHVTGEDGGNDEEIIGMVMMNDTFADPCESVMHQDLRDYVIRSISILSSSEQDALKLYYGIEHPHPYNQHEIASIMHISQSYVSRLIKSATKKLKAYVLSTMTV